MKHLPLPIQLALRKGLSAIDKNAVPQTEGWVTVSVSSPLRVMWVTLQKGHCQLCPTVCITLLTSLLLVYLSFPSALSLIFCLSLFPHVVLSPCMFPATLTSYIKLLLKRNNTLCSWLWTAHLIQNDAVKGVLIDFLFFSLHWAVTNPPRIIVPVTYTSVSESVSFKQKC